MQAAIAINNQSAIIENGGFNINLVDDFIAYIDSHLATEGMHS